MPRKPFSPVIHSLLDTDLYKYTMQQVMFSRYPQAQAKMSFRCRSGQLHIDARELRHQINSLSSLRLNKEELQWLGSLPFVTNSFVNWLADFQLDPGCVSLQEHSEGIQIDVSGNWAAITHFEIFILAIISELHCRNTFNKDAEQEGRHRLADKISALQDALATGCEGFSLVDFGTRRRFSRIWHEVVVRQLNDNLPGVFSGTSNLHLARTLNLMPVGTMAHEWLLAHQALGKQLRNFQSEALETWLHFYNGQLGIALTDTIGMQAFLRDFDRDMATAYAGIRHDSGDPFVWGEQTLAHYKRLGIDAREKKFVFSDKLDFTTAVKLYRHFAGQVNTIFGIGTYLTNDMGTSAPNIVLKLVELNGQPVAKLSDSPGKMMCEDDAYVEKLKASFSA